MGSSTTQPKLFLLATQLEAKPLLGHQHWGWKASETSSQLFLDQKSQDALLITDIGPTRSALNIGHYSKRFSSHLWVNLGVAGALSEDLQLGDHNKISLSLSGYEKHPFDRSMDEIDLPDQGGWSCFTLGEGLHDDLKKAELAELAQVVDMELYPLALASKRMNLKIESYKIVSDFSSQTDKHQIVKRIPALMESLLDVWINSAQRSHLP